MSVADQITRIQTNIANAYSSCEAKGATLPKIQNSDNLASVIDSIENGGSGGSGETIEVLNKTGAVINAGDKVWLSENTQSAGFLYSVGGDSISSSNYARAGVLSRSGNFMVFNNKTYSIGTKTEGYTQLGNFEAIVYSIIYAPNQAIFARGIYGGSTKRTYRVDEGNQYVVDNAWYVGEDYFILRDTGAIWVYKRNLDNGDFISSFKIEDSLFSYADANNIIIKNDEIYVLYNTSSTTSSWCKFVYEESSWVKKTISVSNRQGYNGFPLGFTADGKYIICGNGFTSSSTGNLRLIEVIDDTHMRILTQAEMPADLQTYYSANGMYAFNPYTGVLTACVNGGTDYVIMKYENGEWTKVAVDWNLGSNKFYGGIAVSDDLSRISTLCSSSSSTAFQRAYNLVSTDGYSAIPYKPYTVNENTITATALAESQPNELTQVQIGSVTNEDLTVTENGTYTPSATYTGFGSVTVNIESSGNGGATVTAINKTGKAITTGDKLWINTYEKTSDSNPKLSLLGVDSYYGARVYMPDNEGNVYLLDNSRSDGISFYALQPDETYADAISLPYSADFNFNYIDFDDNGVVFISNYTRKPTKFTQTQMITTVDNVCWFDKKYYFDKTNNYSYISGLGTWKGNNSFDKGEAYTFSASDNTPHPKGSVWKDNSGENNFYYLEGNNIYKVSINDEEKTASIITAFTNHTEFGDIVNHAVTSDNKYVILYYNAAGTLTVQDPLSYNLRFAEVQDDGDLRVLSAEEMSDVGMIYSGYNAIYNPYCDIMIVTKPGSGEVLSYKYNTKLKSFEKIILNITLPDNVTVSNKGFWGYVSNDGKTLALRYGDYANYSWLVSSVVYRLISNGVVTEAFNFTSMLINEDTITGYAGNDALPDEEITVGIASVPGSTPSVTGGSDTFESQLLLENLINSGDLNKEEEIVNQTTSILENLLGE
jgi:hypothetical protein